MRRGRLLAALVLLALGAVATLLTGNAIVFGIVAALVVVAMLAHLRQRRAGASAPPAPVAVPPEEVELEEGPVVACMQCGNPGVRQAGLGEGGLPGAGAAMTWICPRCGNRGPALEFDDATAYRQFVKGLHEPGKP